MGFYGCLFVDVCVCVIIIMVITYHQIIVDEGMEDDDDDDYGNGEIFQGEKKHD